MRPGGESPERKSAAKERQSEGRGGWERPDGRGFPGHMKQVFFGQVGSEVRRVSAVKTSWKQELGIKAEERDLGWIRSLAPGERACQLRRARNQHETPFKGFGEDEPTNNTGE